MKDLSVLISILNFLGLSGFGFFVYYLFKGLKERISNLSKLAEEQKLTLEIVRERAIEIDKLSKYYKQTLEDFQDMGIKLENRRKRLIEEIEDAIERKDKELEKFKKNEFQDVELKEQSLKRISELESKLDLTIEQLSEQISIITSKNKEKPFSISTEMSSSMVADYFVSKIKIFDYENKSGYSFLKLILFKSILESHYGKLEENCPLDLSYMLLKGIQNKDNYRKIEDIKTED